MNAIALLPRLLPHAPTLFAVSLFVHVARCAQVVSLDGAAGGPRFDGIGVVNGGGATSVLLKDYPEPQRSQILDLVYKPKFGASVSALLVEIPGDGNSTQGSMPSHMHTRDDLDYTRGYTWWILREAKKRNPEISLDGAAWSAPGWVGNGNFWSQDAVDYYVKWLQGLRSVYGLEFDAIGCRNEKGVSFDFAEKLRASLDANGFQKVKIHASDDWPKNKLDFVKDLPTDKAACDAIGIISAHTLAEIPASAQVREMAARLGKPIWDTEEHVYLKGFDCAIGIVKAFNENFLQSGATKIVNWYDIAGVYPIEPYSEDPATILARSPWSGHYDIREALWGYAHYGQFTSIGWHYLGDGCGRLEGGGTFVTLEAPAGGDYSIILETHGAKASQQVRFQVFGDLSPKPLCVWRSDARAQFLRQPDVVPAEGTFAITLEPNAIYSLSTTTGQQKGSFANIPAAKAFPFPYYETFEEYTEPKAWGWLPHYTADISGAFEIANRPDGRGKCLHQVAPIRAISWAPDWQPYTILGEDRWQDYEVSADIWLNPGDSAGVMGRINHVGTGYGSIPKGYFLQLGTDGECRLVVVRGKKDKKQVVGDAEQQRLIAAGKGVGEGGEKELGRIYLPDIQSGHWYNLKLRFQGSSITAFVNGKSILEASDTLYTHGMAGLLAGGQKSRQSTPWFDNLLINRTGASVPPPSSVIPGLSPIYR